MKTLRLIILAFVLAIPARAQVHLLVTTNGALLGPVDFFTFNSNLIVSAVGGAFGGGGTGNASTNATQAWAAGFTQTFLGPVYFGTTNAVTELAGKQNADAQLDVVANLTSGTATNFLAGDGTFKQVTTNMIPGLVADILAAASGGGGTGNASTNLEQGWSSRQTFAAGIDAPGTNNLGILHVVSIQPDVALDQSAGGTGGTNAETARIALGLDPDVDVQAYHLALKQLALAILASGDVPYRNSGGVVTNAPSTTFGRSLWNGADAAAVRALLSAVYLGGDTMTGPLLVPYIGSVSGHTNVGSNQVATLRALAEVEARVAAGGLISSTDTNLQINAGVLSITNFNPGATGPIVRQSDLDTASVQATNAVLVEVLTNLTGTWTQPSGAKLHRIIAFGGGGGGGSGARGTNAWAGGGGGGGGGAMIDAFFLPAELTSTVAYTNGAGGGGGAPATVDFSKGTAGTNGGSTFFGAFVLATAGNGGAGGTTNTSAAAGGSSSSSAMFAGTAGGAGSAGAGTGGSQGVNITGRPGGASGGGGGGGLLASASSTNSPSSGGSVFGANLWLGGNAGTTSSGNGLAGNSWSMTGSVPKPGTGGGGGSPTATTPGVGGSGGWPAGGGGGGAGVRNGTDSGAGGNGAPGTIVIITHF